MNTISRIWCNRNSRSLPWRHSLPMTINRMTMTINRKDTCTCLTSQFFFRKTDLKLTVSSIMEGLIGRNKTVRSRSLLLKRMMLNPKIKTFSLVSCHQLTTNLLIIWTTANINSPWQIFGVKATSDGMDQMFGTNVRRNIIDVMRQTYNFPVRKWLFVTLHINAITSTYQVLMHLWFAYENHNFKYLTQTQWVPRSIAIILYYWINKRLFKNGSLPIHTYL